MKYVEIKKLLEDNNLTCSISLDIVGCVLAALPEKVDDETFATICGYIRYIWDKVKQSYTQLIADIVVDGLYNCFKYYNRVPLTLDDLIEHTKDDEVFRQYNERYYD